MSIDALEYLEVVGPTGARASTAYMYGVHSFIDSPCATDYDPWVHAGMLELPVVVNDTLPTPQMVACYSPRRDAIFVRPNLHSAVERCAIAHEIVHYEHNDIGTTRTQEDRANRIAAQRLIRPTRLEEISALTEDPARIALELDVTERIMATYMRARV